MYRVPTHGGLRNATKLWAFAALAIWGCAEQETPISPFCEAGAPCAGYTLLGGPPDEPDAEPTALLIDMRGDLVHSWGITGFPPKLLPGGSLLGCSGVAPGSYDCIELQQRSWDDELEWSFSDWVQRGSGTSARHHHDLQREDNPVGFYAPGQEFQGDGHTLVLAHLIKLVPQIRAEPIDDDVIYEVDANGERTGFEWHAASHIDELGFDEAAREDIATREEPILEWLHGNSISLLGDNRWFDEGHEEFAPDNIIYSSRSANFVIIIDRESGEVVWRVGPDFEGRPEEGLGQFAGQHHAHMIPRGLPGAGNILVFDNGGGSGYGGESGDDRYERDYSRVIEFDPISFEIVWQYGSEAGRERFFSRFLSSAQRLPNGNTLITLGTPGEVIEVTPRNRVVWRHRRNSSHGSGNWIYRAYRVPPEWLPEGVNERYGAYETWAAQAGAARAVSEPER